MTAFYFQHDIDAVDDIKMQGFLSQWGAAGYGYWWRITEMLHEAESHKLPLKPYTYSAIAKQMLANAQQLPKVAKQVQAIAESLINDYDLLVSDGEFFWSNRVIRNIDKINAISDKRKQAGRLGAIAKQNLANAEQNLANKKENINKKKKKNTIPPDGGLQEDTLFQKCLGEYDKFSLEKTGCGEKFSIAGRAGLSGILLHLETTIKKQNESNKVEEPPEATEKRVLEGWSYILSNFDKWEPFHQKQLKLEQINSNLPNILSAIKNYGHGGQTTTGKPATGNLNAAYKAELLNKMGGGASSGFAGTNGDTG